MDLASSKIINFSVYILTTDESELTLFIILEDIKNALKRTSANQSLSQRL